MLMTMNPSRLPYLNKEANKNKKAEEWSSACHSVLTSLHKSLVILYDGVEKDEDKVTLREEEAERSASQTLSEIAEAFVQQCGKLNVLLSTPTNGQMKLPLSALIGVISRCLKVSYADVKSIPSLTELAELLPSIHLSVLHTLCLLILCCKTDLLPQSLTIIDLCLQTLTSMRSIEFTKKCETRACVYRVLCLLVETCGWGRHMTRHSKTIIQEVAADIQWRNSSKQASEYASPSKKESEADLPRKGKKKKKNKAESYNDLTAGDGPETVQNGQILPSSVEVTVQGLELARLALENLEFSTAESLMRCILDTVILLQREETSVPSPYIDNRWRKGLYSAVFACVTVTFGPTNNRKDTVTHFQMTNLALSLLTRGQQLETFHEVKTACRQALNIFRLTGNLNRPIVRRILPHENNDVQDTTELEREVEKLSEENDNLRERLVTSEMDNEAQKRLISSLRQEIEKLRSMSNTQAINVTQSQVEINVSKPTQKMEVSHDNNSDIEDEEEEETAQHVGKKSKDNTTRAESQPATSQATREKVPHKEGRNTLVSDRPERLSEKASSSSVLLSTDLIKPKTKKRHMEQESEATTKKKKTKNVTGQSDEDSPQVLLEEVPGTSTLAQLSGSSSNQRPNVEIRDADDFDNVQAMIADFVDAEPDLS